MTKEANPRPGTMLLHVASDCGYGGKSTEYPDSMPAPVGGLALRHSLARSVLTTTRAHKEQLKTRC
eukprot:2068840-Alexandrium_andersonii.AAC.1